MKTCLLNGEITATIKKTGDLLANSNIRGKRKKKKKKTLEKEKAGITTDTEGIKKIIVASEARLPEFESQLCQLLGKLLNLSSWPRFSHL